jgi:hypothetical protein
MTEPQVRTVLLEEDPIAGQRLGRHIRHDERSRGFAVEAAPLGTLTSVRHPRRVAPYNQARLGSCVPNTGCGVLSTEPFTHRYHEASAIRYYRKVTAVDPWPGQWPPDDTGSDGLSMAKVFLSEGKIARYDHAFSLEAALTALQTTAVMIGMSWLTACDNPDADGLIHYTGSVRGGHEIEADEVDVERRLVGFTNSWGPDWAAAGRFYMSWDDLGTALDDQGDVTVLVP